MSTIDVRSGVDLSDPDVFADGPPHELFAAYRREQPVAWNASAFGDDFWSLTRHDDISAVSKDFETFSSARGSITIEPGTLVPREMEALTFIMMDPPEHRKHRNIVQEVFSPGMVAARERVIREVAIDRINAVVERGGCDVVEDLAVDLPLIVVASMLGVPTADRDQLFEWTNILAAPDDPEMRPSQGALLQALGDMSMYLMALVADRRQHPADDILSRLILTEVNGERLNDIELMSVFSLLLAGGSETTRSTIAGGVRALMEHPDQRQCLIDDPTLMDSAVEEIIRWQTPFNYMARTATRDVDLRGVQIRENQKVVMWLTAGNRDPEVFDRPDEFDITRGSRSKQVAFGAGGRHHCIGHVLARLELSVFLQELLQRIPMMEPVSTPTRVRSTFLHGYKAMPVTFAPSTPTP